MDYNDVYKINRLIEGYVDLHGDTALANRALPPIKQCPCSVDTRHDISHVKPNYSDNNMKYVSSSNSSIPVVIKRYNDGYHVLENKDGNDIESNQVKWNDFSNEDSSSSSTSSSAKSPKMGTITQFYYGSISVVALYVVYRMIQRSR